MLCAGAGLNTAVGILLEAGADPLHRDIDGNTAVHAAYAYGAASVIGRLERAVGADVDVGVNNFGLSPHEISGNTRRCSGLLS